LISPQRAAEPLLRVEGLAKHFGGVHASDNLFLDVAPGEVHAVIGPNGAGKSTLIAMLSGELRPDAGRVSFAGDDISRTSVAQRARRGLVRSFQITSILPSLSVEDNVALAVQATQSHSYRFWADASVDPSLRGPARELLGRMGLISRAPVAASSLAHGEQRQLELAMTLATKPRLLLLDEPLAGMGIEESGRMLALLGLLKGEVTMLLVEHDMDAVFALANRVSVMVDGRVIVVGSVAEIRANQVVRAAYLGEEEA